MSTLDPTFRSYSSQQAAAYASARGSYSSSLYDHILQYHSRYGNGQLNALLDLGCGTGKATRELAEHFDRATGLDPSTEMVAQARKIGGMTRTGSLVAYDVAGAEELQSATAVDTGPVDLISAGMSAHWFHMGEFWIQAARVLKSGGTVAIWTHSSLFCHPATPNAEAVQQILSHLEDVILGPYELPPNRVSRSMYETLSMPWDINPDQTEFPRENFVRIEWNRDGRLEFDSADFFGGSEESTLENLEKALGTASMVTRWREGHPELVGTEEDCVKKTVKDIAEAMGRGSDSLDQIKLRTAGSTTLLLLTKSDVDRRGGERAKEYRVVD